jgi:hypothetical protein
LSVDISKCFTAYCNQHEFNDMERRVYIMHQSDTTDGPDRRSRGAVDISLYYRFRHDDTNFAHNVNALFPFLFIEFTKVETKSIESKYPQASLYANFLYKQMQFNIKKIWVPLLGIIMSENEMLFRVYALSLVNKSWKIAEIDIMRCDINEDNILRLIHVMVGWTKYCSEFLCSPLLSTCQSPSKLYAMLCPKKHSSVVVMNNQIFKCFDYRSLTMRANCDIANRRKVENFEHSELNHRLVIDWTEKDTVLDKLQIICYDKVPGVHYPTYIEHILQVVCKIQKLHSNNIVHGDIRLANIVFSESNDAHITSTIIDFDYSGVENESRYSSRFNTNIPDGCRHETAIADAPLKKEHDIFAIQWICKQFTPKNEELKDVWNEYVNMMEFRMEFFLHHFSELRYELLLSSHETISCTK